jgi:NADH:ubiquinone oxidoreductase subunit 6 (subunit J)
MKRFSPFTLLYLATGICLTAIAFGHTDMTPNAKVSLVVAAGLLYLCAVFTTFPFWHQFAQRSQERLRDKPVWQQNFVAIAPWLVIASVLVSAIVDVLNHSLAIEALANLPLIFLSVENLLVRNQILQ